MGNPIVSVIVATYRREKRLRMALKSLEKQLCNAFEVIVVDDNDDVKWNEKIQAIVESFEKRSTLQIRLLINHPNLGSAEARNCGIKAAKGKYVTFLDDDDVYLPCKISNQYNEMKKKGADYCISNLSLFNEKGKLLEVRTRPYLLSQEADNLLVCHLKYHMTATDTMMFKRDYLLEIGMFEPIDVGDEYYLMMKAINGGGKFAYLNRSDVKALVHTKEAGLSNGQGKIDGENALYAFKKDFFPMLDVSGQRYVKMRHHAVLAFAYFRMGNIYMFIIENLKSFFNSPIKFVKLILHLK